MFPREGQETIWSVAKPLMEQASKKGMDPRDFLQRGMLTPELIRGTPDFSTLLKDPQYRRILEQAGYGEQLGKMKPFEFPVSSTSLTLPEQRYLEKTAGTLGELQKLRGREAGAKSVTFPTEGYRPEKVYPTEQSEQITGRVTGHLPGLVDAPQSTRNYYSPRAAKAFQDLQGRDVLHEAVNLPTLEGRPATGAYQPETGPPEINLVRALPVESEVVRRAGGRPGIPKETQRKLTGVAAVRGPMLAQAAQTWNVGIPWDQGVSLRLPRLDRAPVELMEAAMKKYPKLIFADTGLGVNVINFGELFPPELVLDLQRCGQGTGWQDGAVLHAAAGHPQGAGTRGFDESAADHARSGPRGS
jgi:hypothetical protein